MYIEPPEALENVTISEIRSLFVVFLNSIFLCFSLVENLLQVGRGHDKEFAGNCITLLTETEGFIKRNSRRIWKVVGFHREEREDYPMEALVNAIIHRDYYINGSEIHVDMYDDHLDIISPGGMSDGRQIQFLDIQQVSSRRRNPVIADIFSRLGYAERRGSGLSRIRDCFADEESVKFTSDDAVFVVTMRNANIEDGILTEEESALLQGESALLGGKSALPQGESALLEGEFFLANLNECLGEKVSKKTLDSIYMLFKERGYDQPFGRKDVALMFGVKERRASMILDMMCSMRVAVREKMNTYYFIR